MGRKSKPIMHLIILVCGLFMHLISPHPYSLLTKALTHAQQTTTRKEDKDVTDFKKNIRFPKNQIQETV